MLSKIWFPHTETIWRELQR